MSAGWQQFDEIEATFRPAVTRTLRPGTERLVGHRLRLYCAWSINLDDDGGDYVGQHAWLLKDRPIDADDDPGWIPTEDLADIVVVPLSVEEGR